jgi:peptide/nickel transport system permease protein
MVSLFILAIFYLMALCSPVVAPYETERKFIDHIFAPPHRILFDRENGFHTHALRRIQDPRTLESHYEIDSASTVELGFFVPGKPVRLLGLIPVDWRLFGPRDPAQPFFLIGADAYGRDVFSRIVHGSAISLSIGLVAIGVSFVLGVAIGGLSGYAGGKVDLVLQRLIEIVGAFPQLPLWLALATVIPDEWSPLQTYFGITVLLSLIGWEGLARVVRGKILSLREEDYAHAARLLGASSGRVLFRHLIPGFTSHIIVALTLSIPGMILGETALSFLGLGLRPPVVSWGVMLQDCMNIQVITVYPWVLTPALFIIITVLAFNFVGDGLRDAADPYLN